MKNSRNSIFLFFFIFTFYGFSQIKEKQYFFKSITTEDGLSNNIVYDILQDKEGYIWIATDNGLNKYDGYTVKKFFHKVTDSTSLSSNLVRSITKDSNENLWFGTKKGLLLYNNKEQNFLQFHKAMDSVFTNTEIMKMGADKNGRLWFNTQGDLGYINYSQPDSKPINFASNITNIAIGNPEKLWTNSNLGELRSLDVTSKKTTALIKDSTLIMQKIHYGKFSKHLWLPENFNANLNATPFYNLPKLPHNLEPYVLLELDTETLWMGTNAGLYEYNYKERVLHKIKLNSSTLTQQIRSLYQDNNNGVWVGTLSGVYHYDPNRKIFNHTILENDSDDIIMGIHSDDVNGVYVNTLGKGLYHKPIDSNTFKNLSFPESFPAEGLFIWDIEYLSENKFPLWLSTNKGLFCYNPERKAYKKIELTIHDNIFEESFTILNTDKEYIWVASHKALHKITKANGAITAIVSLTKFITYSGIQKIVSLGDYIFIATEGEGLFSFNKKSEVIAPVFVKTEASKNHLLKTAIWDLHVNNSTLWIGANDGLYNLELKDMFIKPTLVDNQIIFSILQDDEGVLWMGSDKGLKSFLPKTNSSILYNTNHGLKNIEFNRRSAIKTADGKFWFGGINGISSFNPNQIKKSNPNKPLIYIKDLKVITSDSTFIVSHDQKEVILPWKHNTIEIDYVGLNYTNPSQNKYKYQMVGYDPTWVETTKPNKARYVRLPIGSYTFKVVAANNDDLWNNIGNEIKIKIKPPIWRTNIAYILYVLFLMGLIHLVNRLIKYRKRIKEVEIEKEIISKKVEAVAIVLNNKSKIYLDKLKYIKSDGNYLEFITETKMIIDRNNLKAILNQLPPNFVRVHRSYVINKNFIDASNSTTIFLKPNIEIPLSRTFKTNLT